MNKEILFAPFLSAVVALGAFAQQPNLMAQSDASTQPGVSSSQPANSVEKEPSQQASQDFWDGEEPSLGSLLFHPFASKAYVNRHVGPIRDRVNELEELTATHSTMIKDMDARAQQGIQLASAKVNLADEHAQDAAKKSEAARQTTTSLNSRLDADEKVLGSIDQYKQGAQTEIRFRPGQTVLSKQSKDALDEMASQLKNQHGYIIEVQGFAASQSHAAVADSRKMADSVVRYLVLNHEIPAYRIYTISIGNAEGKGSSRTRVEVNLLKNDVEQIARQ
jgi:outer membrane protein OmpA-like peptidoglycan-associated protein